MESFQNFFVTSDLKVHEKEEDETYIGHLVTTTILKPDLHNLDEETLMFVNESMEFYPNISNGIHVEPYGSFFDTQKCSENIKRIEETAKEYIIENNREEMSYKDENFTIPEDYKTDLQKLNALFNYRKE